MIDVIKPHTWDEIEADLVTFLTSPYAYQRALGKLCKYPREERQEKLEEMGRNDPAIMAGFLQEKIAKALGCPKDMFMLAEDVQSNVEAILEETSSRGNFIRHSGANVRIEDEIIHVAFTIQPQISMNYIHLDLAVARPVEEDDE